MHVFDIFIKLCNCSDQTRQSRAVLYDNLFIHLFSVSSKEKKKGKKYSQIKIREDKTLLWQEESCLSKSLPINHWNGELEKFSNSTLLATGLS